MFALNTKVLAVAVCMIPWCCPLLAEAHRQYDPGKRRFLKRDAMGIKAKQLQLYEYNHSNPLVFRDPTGFEALPHDAIGIPCGIGTGYDICNTLLEPDAEGNTWYERDGSEAVSFCCYTQNPVYGTLYCQKKTCYSEFPIHPCIFAHEELRRKQFGCAMQAVPNPSGQCTQLKCMSIPYMSMCDADCAAYTQLFNCYRGYGLYNPQEQCLLRAMCSTTPCQTIQQAQQTCK